MHKTRKFHQLYRLILMSGFALRFGAALFGQEASELENTLYHSVRATIFVSDMDQAGLSISGWAEERGGYVLRRSSDAVILRFPYGELSDFLAMIESTADQIVELAPSAQDLREEVLGLDSAIASREEILARSLSFLDESDLAGTLEIEREMLALLTQIESLKGLRNRYSVDVVMARADISLRLVRQSIPTNIPSSFPWINSVDFYDFVIGGP